MFYCSAKLDEMKTLQKLRNRPHGVSIVSLALGQKVSNEVDEMAVCIILPFHSS